MTPDLAALLARLYQSAEALPPEEAPEFIGALESAKAKAWARLIVLGNPSMNGSLGGPLVAERDPLLTPEEAARLLGVKVQWLYRHAKRLPFTRRLSRKCLRFSEAGLRKWQAAKRA